MSSKRQLFLLLSSPPPLRTELCRSIFRVGATRPLATIAERHQTAPARSHKYSVQSFTHRYIIRQSRFQSTVSAVNSTPASSPFASSEQPRSTPPPPPSSRIRSIFTTSGLIVIFFAVGFAMAAAPVAEAVNGFINPPTDAETLELYQPETPNAAEINAYIVNHPLAKRLREQESMTESRPHLKIPPAMRAHNLTGGTLLGEDKIEVPPLTFNEKDTELPKLVQMSFLGPALCGHPGIVHGGLLATMLDEGLARACFPALPNKVGVTASLKIDYRQPCPGGSYVVLKAETTKVEGRKAWVKGWIELLGEEDGTGTKVVEAEALFIEPKQAKSMARIYSTS